MDEEWSRSFALDCLKEAIRGLDGEFDDENGVFFDVTFGDESLVVTVKDAVEELNSAVFIVEID